MEESTEGRRRELQDHRNHDMVDVQQVMDEEQVKRVNKKIKRNYEKLDKFEELIQKLEESAEKNDARCPG